MVTHSPEQFLSLALRLKRGCERAYRTAAARSDDGRVENLLITLAKEEKTRVKRIRALMAGPEAEERKLRNPLARLKRNPWREECREVLKKVTEGCLRLIDTTDPDTEWVIQQSHLLAENMLRLYEEATARLVPGEGRLMVERLLDDEKRRLQTLNKMNY